MVLNESPWLQKPSPPDMVAWISQEVGAQAKSLTQENRTGDQPHIAQMSDARTAFLCYDGMGLVSA